MAQIDTIHLGIPVYIALGSNSEGRIEMLKRARLMLSAYMGKVLSKSKVYASDPWGYEEQPAFVNQVVKISTYLDPPALYQALAKSEQILDKRKDSSKYGPRNIDIDILLYGSESIDHPDVQIPHPRMHLRNFVLIPLAEIASGLLIPGFEDPIEVLLEQCEDQGKVTPIEE